MLKYFIKHFCTRLAQNRFSIDSSIIDFLNGSDEIEKLFIHFEIRADLWGLLEKLKLEGNGTGNFHMSSLTVLNYDYEFEAIYSNMIVQWFKVEFLYSDRFTVNNKMDLSKFYNSTNILPLRTLYHIHPDVITEELILENMDSESNFDLRKYINELLVTYF